MEGEKEREGEMVRVRLQNYVALDKRLKFLRIFTQHVASYHHTHTLKFHEILSQAIKLHSVR